MVHGAAGSALDASSGHYWSPAQAGSAFEFSYSLESLAPFREYVTIVSGTDARQADAFAPKEVGADHFRSSAVFLTAAHPKQTSRPDDYNGVSIRSALCADCRAGHAAALDATGQRDGGPDGFVRLRL
jgi:hypothetical protein